MWEQQTVAAVFRKRYKTGFTLVELMISISIIAILSVVLSISFSKAQKDGRDQRRISDLKAVQNAAEQYYSLSGSYPSSSSLYASGQKWTAGGQVVLESYPKDPKNSGSYVYNRSNITTSSYCVCAAVENVNKSSNSEDGCSFVNNGYFCVKNQQ